MTEYSKLKEKGLGRGRPRHTPEQRKVAQEANSARQEARRRAQIVLKNRHKEEFSQIYEVELKALLAGASSQPARRSKSTKK